MELGVGSWSGEVVDDVVVAMLCSAGPGRDVHRDRELLCRTARPRTASGVRQLTEEGLPDVLHQGHSRAGSSRPACTRADQNQH